MVDYFIFHAGMARHKGFPQDYPVPNVRVEFQADPFGGDGEPVTYMPPYVQMTDVHGFAYFNFSKLVEPHNYTVTISKEGYETYQHQQLIDPDLNYHLTQGIEEIGWEPPEYDDKDPTGKWKKMSDAERLAVSFCMAVATIYTLKAIGPTIEKVLEAIPG
jgi:hypothetical protein